jgi:glutamate 5-kinase
LKRSSRTFQKVVVKVGSSILTGAGNAIAAQNMDRVARSIVSLVKGQGRDVIVVTSGAIASGLSALGLKKRPSSLPELQAAAAIGQNILIQAYSQEFEKYGLKCAQILLTREDFGDRKRYLNVKNTIHTLLAHKIIPIINENDAVSTDEIKFGDNDTLSARVAAAVEADALLLLTDIDGLYRDFDPKSRTGVLIREVRQITP